MKSFVRWFLAWLVCWMMPLYAGAETAGPVIQDGAAQPFIAYTSAQDPEYTNESSEILRFVVYVETDYDTDLDGRPDLIKTMVQLPWAAAEGAYAAPVIYEARPYIAGMYGYSPELPPVGVSDFDESGMRTQPDKRTPAGSMTALEAAAQADPGDWYYTIDTDPFAQQYLGNFTTYDEFLVRGFAVVQSAGLGTWGSEGVECCASEMEVEAFRCVIDWLCGRRNAYSDRESNILVPADWCNGRVGMTGRSYAGALAYEVACTCVEGLVTVVPVAGIASWYDYANAQGMPSGLLSTYDSIADLAALCASRFFAPVDESLLHRYEMYLARIRDEQIRLAGDYGPFWAERDYSGKRVNCSALIVHGLNDKTVFPRQFDLMRKAFLRSGCEVKVLLHQNGHVTPANEQTKTDILIGDHTYTELLIRWFTRELMGVENETSSLPAFTVQSNLDGRFYGLDEWNGSELLRLSPEDAGEYTVSAENALFSNDALVRETLDGRNGSDHLVWRMNVQEDLTVCGNVQVHVRARTHDTDRPHLMMGAVLVDAADEPFACYDTGAIGVLEQRVIAEHGVDRGPGVEAYDLVEWQPVQRSRHVVAFGTMDLNNPESGMEPESASRREPALEKDTWHDYTLYLQPSVYTVRAGHHLEVYIVPFCGFSDDAAFYDVTPAEEIRAMGMDPDTLVPVTRDYSFTVDCAQSFADIPLERGKAQ